MAGARLQLELEYKEQNRKNRNLSPKWLKWNNFARGSPRNPISIRYGVMEEASG